MQRIREIASRSFSPNSNGMLRDVVRCSLRAESCMPKGRVLYDVSNATAVLLNKTQSRQIDLDDAKFKFAFQIK